MDTYGVELVIASSEPMTSHQLVVANQHSLLSGSYDQFIYSGPGGPVSLLGDADERGRRKLNPRLSRWFISSHESTFYALRTARPGAVPVIKMIWLVWQHRSIFHPISQAMELEHYIKFANNCEEQVIANMRMVIDSYELRKLGRPKVQTLILEWSDD